MFNLFLSAFHSNTLFSMASLLASLSERKAQKQNPPNPPPPQAQQHLLCAVYK